MGGFYYENTAFDDLPEGKEKERLRVFREDYISLWEEIEADPEGRIVLNERGSVYVTGFSPALDRKIRKAR